MHGGARERLEDLRRALRDRGIYSPGKLLRGQDLDAVAGAVRWWDEQRRRQPDLSAAPLMEAILDGGMPGYGTPAEPPEPCRRSAELTAAWVALDGRLAKVLGHQWGAWAAGVHLHGIGAEFVIACPPDTTSWISERYGRVIAQAAVVPVRFVACDGGSER